VIAIKNPDKHAGKLKFHLLAGISSSYLCKKT
jgi:hypothetical protein